MKPMPHKRSSPRTPDLFEVTLTIPTPLSEPAPAKPAALASLSDAQLARQLGQVLEEVQRRMEEGRGSRPELKAAIRNASVALKRLSPQPSKQRVKSSRSGKTRRSSCSTTSRGTPRRRTHVVWRCNCPGIPTAA